jgi:hypothetical protein
MKGGAPGQKDIYTDPKGNIYVVPKGKDGRHGTPEPTGRNIKEFLD